MEKRIKVKVNKIVDSGTTDGIPAGVNDLIDAGQNFLTTVAVGDRVHNTADDEWHTVSDVVDDENLTLNGGTVPTGKTYVIYSATETYDKFIPTKGAFVTSTGTSTTTLTYTGAGSTGADVITVTHEIDSLYNATTNPITRFEISLNDAIKESSQQHWANPVYNMTNPGTLIITTVAIG